MHWKRYTHPPSHLIHISNIKGCTHNNRQLVVTPEETYKPAILWLTYILLKWNHSISNLNTLGKIEMNSNNSYLIVTNKNLTAIEKLKKKSILGIRFKFHLSLHSTSLKDVTVLSAILDLMPPAFHLKTYRLRD